MAQVSATFARMEEEPRQLDPSAGKKDLPWTESAYPLRFSLKKKKVFCNKWKSAMSYCNNGFHAGVRGLVRSTPCSLPGRTSLMIGQMIKRLWYGYGKECGFRLAQPLSEAGRIASISRAVSVPLAEHL